jgi:UDP-N-acetylmuramate dehydrogenase
VQLASYVQARVQSEFGVLLQPEPILVGVVL